MKILYAGLTAAALIVAGPLPGVARAADNTLELKISGVEGELLANVRAFLGIARYAPEKRVLALPKIGDEAPPKPTEDALRTLHQRADQEIRDALQPFGYYRPAIKKALVRDGDRWQASYDIDPGVAVVLRSVDIRIEGGGAGNPALLGLRDSAALQPGQRLEHAPYEALKKTLLETALSNGYLDARFARSELRVSVAQGSADVVLVLDTGAQYFFGAITVEQDILREDFVARYVKLRPGTVFDARELLDLQLALSDSGYFRRVEIQVEREQAQDQRIPVRVITEAAKPRRYGVGLGFGTDTGPRLSLSAEYRRINRRGHSVTSDLRASQIKNELGLRYQIPIGNVTTDRLVFSGKAQAEKVSDGGDSQRVVLGMSHNTQWKTYHRRLYLNFQREDFEIGADGDEVSYLIPGASLSRLKSDNLFFPRRGYSWTMDARGSSGHVLSETSFLRGELGARAVFALGERGRLLVRGQAGTTAVEDYSRLPTTERFFAGGDQSVRGYGYQRIGPNDESGEIVGGRHLLVGSVEVERLVYGDFGAALFVDSGDAFNAASPDFKTGAGVGLRWRSPIGMLRIDVAHPFNDTDDDYRIHISIGPDL